MSLKKVIIKILQNNNAKELTIREITETVMKNWNNNSNSKHLDATVRSILNRGVKEGIFIRTGKGKYALTTQTTQQINTKSVTQQTNIKPAQQKTPHPSHETLQEVFQEFLKFMEDEE